MSRRGGEAIGNAYFAFFAAFATWRETYPLESGRFTQRRKGEKDRQAKLGHYQAIEWPYVTAVARDTLSANGRVRKSPADETRHDLL